jgi:AcrR family transcriptional regulator
LQPGDEKDVIGVAEQATGLAALGVRPPLRADARRNFDALIAAAREVFAEQGTDASLEEIARRAGVGIGTLYRNFPTRQDLFERVYIGEVEDLCAAARNLADQPPWDALATWLRRFIDYIATKRALMQALSTGNPVFSACRAEMYSAGIPLFERAQAAGEVRADLEFDDLVRMLSGLTSATFTDDEQRERVFRIALDGVRAR